MALKQSWLVIMVIAIPARSALVSPFRDLALLEALVLQVNFWIVFKIDNCPASSTVQGRVLHMCPWQQERGKFSLREVLRLIISSRPITYCVYSALKKSKSTI